MKRIRLDEEHYKALVRGGEVTLVDGTKIILADIGFGLMRDHIASAEAGIDIHKGYEEKTS
jgi:hypothetical protein